MPDHLDPAPRSAVSRITAILSTFLSGGTHSVTEIARMTGLPMSTAHRIAVELAARQLLHRTPDGRYRVGIIVAQLGGRARSAPALVERGPQVVTDLAEATRRRARLGLLDNGRVSYIEKRVGPEPVTPFDSAATLPAHATALGKALLAFAPAEALAAALAQLTAYTPHTLCRPDQLRHALGAVRLTRSAMAHGELVAGESALAVPVFGGRGEVVAALELEMPDPRTDLEVCRAALTVAARGLSRELAVGPEPAEPPRLRLLPAAGGAAVPLS